MFTANQYTHRLWERYSHHSTKQHACGRRVSRGYYWSGGRDGWCCSVRPTNNCGRGAPLPGALRAAAPRPLDHWPAPSLRRIAVFFFFQAEDGIRDIGVTGVQTCALPISAATQDPKFNAGMLQLEYVPKLPLVFYSRLQVIRNQRQAIAGTPGDFGDQDFQLVGEIGRASCRERV